MPGVRPDPQIAGAAMTPSPPHRANGRPHQSQHHAARLRRHGEVAIVTRKAQGRCLNSVDRRANHSQRSRARRDPDSHTRNDCPDQRSHKRHQGVTPIAVALTWNREQSVGDSRPQGATVFIDGKLAGATPLSVPAVPAGDHAVRLEREGYRRWTSSVRIVAPGQNRVTASLER